MSIVDVTARPKKIGDLEKRDEMIDDRLILLNAREAAHYLRVSLFTLSRIEKEGGIVPFRTPGGHRRYSLRMLHEYLENSRNSWKPKYDAMPHQPAEVSDIKESPLELTQA